MKDFGNILLNSAVSLEKVKRGGSKIREGMLRETFASLDTCPALPASLGAL